MPPGPTSATKELGTYGLAGCFSFFPNKVLGVGEGGALCTDSDEIAERVRRLRSQGMTATTMDRHRGTAMSYDVVEVGFNYRFDDLRAAIIRPRFARLGAEIERRRELIARYRELLDGVEGLGIAYRGNDETRSSCYLMGILVEPEFRQPVRDRLRDEHGVQTTVYPATHELGGYVREFGEVSLPKTEDAAARLFSIPLYPHMALDLQDHVAAAVRESVAHVLEGVVMSEPWKVTLTEISLPGVGRRGGPRHASLGLAHDGPEDAGARGRRSASTRAPSTRLPSRARRPRSTWHASLRAWGRATR